MMTKTDLTGELQQFTGDLDRWRHPLVRSLIYTPGIKFFAEHGGQHGAYWLIDAIASYQPEISRRGSEDLKSFQVWRLKVNDDQSAELVCYEDDGKPFIFRQKIDYTDFQLGEIKFYVADNGDGTRTLMLPSEW